MSRFALISVLFSCVCCIMLREVAAAPYQELAPRAGHVPVYIRVGDTPLSEIHPGLAEAFHEIESDSLKIENASDADKATAAPATKSDTSDAPAPLPAEPTKESDIASFDKIKDEPKNEAASNTKQ